MILMEKELLEHLTKKELRKIINQKEFRIEKVIKKDDKLYVKWKGGNKSFNSWIGKKRHSLNG